MSGPNAEQAEYWEDLAPSWLEGEQHSAKVAGRFGQRAIDRLDVQPGQRVLDIGCGSGPTTIALARLALPDGQSVGVDIAPSLVTAARQRAEAAGVTNAQFMVADVQTDDLGETPFDAAFSRFGVMFFADPDVAFGRIRQLLRPDGSFVFACWQNVFANEWMFLPGTAVVAVTGELPPMPGPDQPGPFSLAEPGRVEALLTSAGFRDIEVESVEETIVLPVADVASLTELSQRVGPVREALREADDETRQRVIDAVREAFEAKVTDGELRLGAAAFVARSRA
jgi:SAM-dependent methyltransferase